MPLVDASVLPEFKTLIFFIFSTGENKKVMYRVSRMCARAALHSLFPPFLVCVSRRLFL